MKSLFIILLLLSSSYGQEVEELRVEPAKKRLLNEDDSTSHYFLQIATSLHRKSINDLDIATGGHLRFSGGYHYNDKWSVAGEFEVFLDDNYQSTILSGTQFGVGYCFNLCSPTIKEEQKGITIKEISKWSDSLYFLYNFQSLRLANSTISFSGPAIRYEKSYFLNSNYSWNFFGEYKNLINDGSTLNSMLLGAGLRLHFD